MLDFLDASDWPEILTVNNLPIRYVRVFDGDGVEWRDVIEVNRSTGELKKYKRDEAGRLWTWFKSDGGNEVQKETVMLKMPVIFKAVRIVRKETV